MNALASMGPQPFGCGRSTKSTRSRARPSFNGAATFRLRKGGTGGRARRTPGSFNGAATFRLRKAQPAQAHADGRRASMGPQPFGCGRRGGGHRRKHAIALASMGPQPFGCGRVHGAARPGVNLLLQWGRNLSVAEGLRRRRGFDGNAASMGPQPFGCGRSSGGSTASPWMGLQWGRNLSVAEG